MLQVELVGASDTSMPQMISDIVDVEALICVDAWRSDCRDIPKAALLPRCIRVSRVYPTTVRQLNDFDEFLNSCFFSNE